ncbi:MAG: type II secretion system F family protein, partial [Pseudomonadota bacterium]
MASFTQAWEFLIAAFGPLGPLYALGFLGMVLILLSAPMAFKQKEDPFKKLRGSSVAVGGGKGPSKEAAVRLRYDSGGANLDRFAHLLEPKDQKEFSETRMRLIQAGYRARSAVSTYHLFRFVLGVGALALGTLSVFILPGNPSLSTVILSILVPGVVGYFLPNYWVTRRIQTRQEDVTNGFPD